MPHPLRLAFPVLLVATFAFLLTGCGSDSESESSSSPTSPSVSNPRDGAPGLTLAGLSLSGSSYVSQQTGQGKVTLTGAAPSSGALVTLSSNNSLVARVPSTVMVGGGAVEAAFTFETATVMISTPVTISAAFNSSSRSAELMVRPPTVSAAFTVTSPARGSGACVLGPSNGAADCVLDGSASKGPVDRWNWTYWTAGNPIGHVSSQPRSGLNLSSRCAFFEGSHGGDGPNGDRYIQMEVELVVQDAEGNRSAAVRQPVKMYPNRMCGFTY